MADFSVSKGVFAHKGYRKIGQGKKSKSTMEFKKSCWFYSYKEILSEIEIATKKVNSKIFNQTLTDTLKFVSTIEKTPLSEFNNEIPTAIVLAGINLDDHITLFDEIKANCQEVSDYVATVWSREASNLKSLIETIIYQFINPSEQLDKGEENVKKSQCTFCSFQAWHKNNSDSEEPFVILIPDFESFSPKILHHFILTLSSYLKYIKFVLIFGVATSLHVIHRTLSYDSTSKLRVQVFSTKKQTDTLAEILDGILLSPQVPFKLIGRTFKLLIELFLFCDFSVGQFLERYKLCLIEHFSNDNIKSLCCKKSNISKNVSALSDGDLHRIFNLPSIKNVDKTSNSVSDLLNNFHVYLDHFLLVLKCLHEFTKYLPNHPLGKLFRDLYEKSVGTKNINETDEYKLSIQLLQHYSKEDLLKSLEQVLVILNDKCDALPEEREKLEWFKEKILSASTDIGNSNGVLDTPNLAAKNRIQLLKNLRQNAKKESELNNYSEFKKAQLDFIEYLDHCLFSKYLTTPFKVPLNEIFCFDNLEIKMKLRGSHKALINSNLNYPSLYLECECCKTDDDGYTNSFPDLNLIYKLHTECGKMINIYDLLQSFSYITDPKDDSDEQEISPDIQARFDKCMSYLTFLGFIKPTKRKTDHVKRLL